MTTTTIRPTKQLRNPIARFPYEVIENLVLAGDEESISAKEAGSRLAVSERQIYVARERGFVDAYMADVMLIRGAGVHPVAVFGFDAWVYGPDILLDAKGVPRGDVDALTEGPLDLREEATA